MKIMIRVITILTLMVSLGYAKQGGAYFGGALGQSFVQTDLSELENPDLKLDENGFAFKLMAGVLIGNNLALEGGYRSFGTVKSKAGDVEFNSNITGYDLHALGRVDLKLLELFAKAGYTFWDQKSVVEDDEENDSGGAFSWGFGAMVKLGGLGVRAEWERFEVQSFDRLSMLTLGIVFGM